MSKKNNLKAEKAKRNKEYALKFKKRKVYVRRGGPRRPGPGTGAPGTGEGTGTQQQVGV